MGALIVITGPPGAGKSTLGAVLADAYDPGALVAGDAFFGFLRRGALDPWRREADAQNIVLVEASAMTAGRLTDQCDVVYDGVVGPWMLTTFLRSSGLPHVDYAVLLPPLDECLQRVATRAGHGFTDLDAAEHMWREFHDAEIDRRHLITDVAPAEELARRIRRLAASGAIRYPRLGTDHPLG